LQRNLRIGQSDHRSCFFGPFPRSLRLLAKPKTGKRRQGWRGKKSLRQTTDDVGVTSAGARENKLGLQAKQSAIAKGRRNEGCIAIRSVNGKPPPDGSSPNLDKTAEGRRLHLQQKEMRISYSLTRG
jgi:hypothetical protein